MTKEARMRHEEIMAHIQKVKEVLEYKDHEITRLQHQVRVQQKIIREQIGWIAELQDMYDKLHEKKS